MKRILISILFVLLMAVSAWEAQAATVYVKNTSGSDVYYESGASSCDDVTAADTAGDLEAALTAAGASGVLNICAGTYSGTEIDAADGLDATAITQTINGIGTVIIDASSIADDAFESLYHNITLNNLIIYGADNQNGLYVARSMIFNNCTVYAGNAFRTYQATATFNGCKLYSTSQSRNCYIFGTDDTKVYTFNNCIISGGLRLNVGRGTVYLNNSLITGMEGIGVLAASTTSVYLTNTMVVGNQLGLTLSYVSVYKEAGAAVLLTNSIALPNPINGDSYFLSAGITESNNQYVSPMFTAPKYPGVIAFSIDDYTQFDSGWDETVAAKLNAYGWGLTFGLNNTDHLTSDEWDRIAAMINNGNEVASHTRHHPDLSDLNAIDIRYTGDASTAVATIDVATNSIAITLAGDQTDGSVNLSIDISNPSYDSIKNIYEYINAQTGYSASTGSTIITGSTGASDDALGISLADIVGQDIKTAEYTMLFDATRYYNEEIANSKSDIETALASRVSGGYTARAFIFPYNRSSAGAIAAVKAAGYLGARTGDSGDYTMDDLTVYDVYGPTLSTVIGTTNIERNVAAWAETANQAGYFASLYTHGNTQYSSDNWDDLISALRKTNLLKMTLGDFFEAIRNAEAGILPAGSTADDGVTWTRTFTDNSNYNLKPGSLAINAGTDPFSDGDGDQYDLAGRLVWSDVRDAPVYLWQDGVDIGAYGFRRSSGFHRPGRALGGGIH